MIGMQHEATAEDFAQAIAEVDRVHCQSRSWTWARELLMRHVAIEVAERQQREAASPLVLMAQRARGVL